MYPKQTYQQPVPYARVPAAAGALPSWEQKKAEMGMANLSVNGAGNDENRAPPAAAAAAAPAPATSKASTLPRSASAGKLQKGNGRPSFLATLRSASSSSTGSEAARHVRDHSYASNTGGIGYDATPSGNGDSIAASPRSASKASGRKKQNPFMRFIQRNFSARYAAEKSAGRQPNGSGSAGVQVSQVPKSQAGSAGRKGDRGIGNTLPKHQAISSSNKKTRSTHFAEKMKATSGKITTKLQQTYLRFNSKTPKEQLPKNWEEWRRAYARVSLQSR